MKKTVLFIIFTSFLFALTPAQICEQEAAKTNPNIDLLKDYCSKAFKKKYYLSKYNEAEKYLLLFLIHKDLLSKKIIATSYSNLASDYSALGDTKKACISITKAMNIQIDMIKNISNGMSIEDALKKAKMDMIEHHISPVYWTPFVLVF